MAQVPVLDINGKQVKTIDLPADIFEAKVNKGLMHQAYVRQMANARLGTHSTQRRSEVSRTTAKMYKQKGTGRARHGSRSAPQFVGGGRAFGPKPRDYSLDMPKKMRQGAIRSALSALLADGQLVFVTDITPSSPKTKDMAKVLNVLAGEKSTLVLFTHDEKLVQRTVSNLDNAKPLLTNYLNVRDLLQYDKVIVSLKALDVIVKIWGLESKENA
ncbi:MAG: 50S ribosomal protein L4 [Chloroflexi bacterium]|uniref:50S ribosomal protein L4 n=1 Tax=Candidatus Flexifilum breve TaxID=3140694 RepID=UPI003135B18D|nr:50S ribosomal protein L4 [Chloroflexota bacterium]